MKIKRIALAMPMIAMMVIIFIFSSQTGGESGGLSYKIARGLSDIMSGIVELPFSLVHLMIRKGAHMTEYAVLLVTVICALYEVKVRKRLVMAYIITVLYAMSDEIHQIFVPGRQGAIADVVIDGLGAYIALLVCTVHMLNKKR